jgi:hypothetical protein
MLTAKPGWEEKFNLYHFNWVLVPNESQLAQLLSKSPQWKVLSQDKVAILLIRQLATGAK